MGHHLNGLSQIVAMTLTIDDRLVDAPCRNRVVAGRMYAREPFVMTQVQVCFHAVDGDVALAVLIRVQRTWIDVDIGIKLLNGYFVATCLQQFADAGRDNAFSQRGNHTACHEDVFCIHTLLF